MLYTTQALDVLVQKLFVRRRFDSLRSDKFCSQVEVHAGGLYDVNHMAAGVCQKAMRRLSVMVPYNCHATAQSGRGG